MAVGKEAPISPCSLAAAQCREALDATVARFTEMVAAVPVATIKKRFKEADIVIPVTVPFASPYTNGSPVVPEIECSNIGRAAFAAPDILEKK